MTIVTPVSKTFNWSGSLIISEVQRFRGHHGGKQGGMWADTVLE